jgi:FHA domain
MTDRIMGCLCCGAGAEVGSLCRPCAQDVAPCEGLIPDHVRSTVTMTDADAWLVDGFGMAHAATEKTTMGRSQDGQLVVLASSVSREHAELKKTEAGWQVRDLGSRNGTFVDGVRSQGRVTLADRAVLKIGDVAMWFLSEVVHEPIAPPSMATGSVGGGLVRFMIQRAESELCVVGGGDTTAGGALLSRASGAESWSERALPPLEFQLLRALCAKATEESDSPAAVRGCVGTKQLARDLPFQSKYANEENVRQVVRRLRGALAEVGADGILAVVPGRGYYLSCTVTAGGADRR